MEDENKEYYDALKKEVIAQLEEEKNKLNTLRIICARCEAVLNNPEKMRILDKLERGVNHKVHCFKCSKEVSEKYLLKNKVVLTEKRKYLRHLVNDDKRKYACSCQGSCKGEGKVIYHRKRNREVHVGTITMKDYKENCEILCLQELPLRIAGIFKKEPTNHIEYVRGIKELNFEDLFDKIDDFQAEMLDWLFAHDNELIQNFELYTFQNTESKYKNNYELLLVANKRDVKGGELKKQVVYSSSSFGERNKDKIAINDAKFELRYCINKFLNEIKYENLLDHYKNYKVPNAFLNEKGDDIRLEVMQPLTLLTYEKLK